MLVVIGCSRHHHVGEVVDLTVQKGFKPTYGRYVHAFHQGLTGLSDAIIVSVSTSRHNIYAPARALPIGFRLFDTMLQLLGSLSLENGRTR